MTVSAPSTRPTRRRPVLGRLALVVGLVALPVLAACGSSDRDVSAIAATRATSPPTTAPATTSPPTTTIPPTTTSTTTTTTTTTSTTSTTTTTTEPPPTLPEQPPGPIAPPQDAYGDEPLIEIGSIEIPRIGVASTLYQGIRLTTLDHGPGYWPGTALPGHEGNTVVAGHRTSKNRVFRDVDQLEPGDEIIFDTVEGRSVYVVSQVLVIEPSDVWIIDPTPTPTATLFACHPPGSVRQRIAVFADLVTD